MAPVAAAAAGKFALSATTQVALKKGVKDGATKLGQAALKKGAQEVMEQSKAPALDQARAMQAQLMQGGASGPASPAGQATARAVNQGR